MPALSMYMSRNQFSRGTQYIQIIIYSCLNIIISNKTMANYAPIILGVATLRTIIINYLFLNSSNTYFIIFFIVLCFFVKIK